MSAAVSVFARKHTRLSMLNMLSGKTTTRGPLTLCCFFLACLFGFPPPPGVPLPSKKSPKFFSLQGGGGRAPAVGLGKFCSRNLPDPRRSRGTGLRSHQQIRRRI